MKAPDQENHEEPDELLRHLGLDSEDDRWMDAIRAAERRVPLGTIGDYELLEEVGRGGQGVVYRAWQPVEQRTIALKRMIAGSFASPRTHRRFEREVEAASALDHPNIVSVFGMTEIVDGQPLIAMEWIEGTPVTRWVDRRRAEGTDFGPRAVLPLVLEICDAVQHAHQRGVIHRDLKPSNILVDAAGRPHLLDFGLAKLLTPEGDVSTLTLTEQFVGTPAYAAPEQLLGSDEVDVRADVYSLGVLFYRLLTGRLPYDLPPRTADWARALEETEPKRPSSIRPRIGREMDTILMKTLAKERALRYQSVDSFSSDLRRYLAGEPISAHPPSALYQLRKLVRRHTWPFAFAATLFVLAIAFGAWSMKQQARLEEQIGLVRDAELAASARAEEAIAARNAAFAAQAEALDARNAALEAQAEAEAQAMRADAGLGFLTDVLTSVDPEQSTGDATVLEALERAELRLGSRFDNDPRTRAILQQTIGRIYVNLTRPDDAEPHLTAALEYFEREFGADHPDTLTTRSTMGELLLAQGEHERAGTLLHETLELQRASEDVSSRDAVRTMQALARAARRAGQFEESEAWLRDALELDAESRGMAQANHHIVKELVATLQLMERWDETEALLRETIAQDRELGGTNLRVSAQLFNLGQHYHARFQDEKAVEVYREALAIETSILRAGHPRIGLMKIQLARALEGVGQLDEARLLAKEGLRIQEAALGALNPRVLNAQLLLGGFLGRAGRNDEARVMIEKGLAGYRELGRTENEEYAVSLVWYGALLCMGGEQDEGMRTMQDGVAILHRIPDGPRHLGVAYHHLASASREAGDSEGAARYYADSAEHFRELEYRHPLLRWALIRLGQLAEERGDAAGSLPYYEEVVDIERGGIPEGPLAFAESLRYVGSLELEAGEPEKAEKMLRECLEVLDSEGVGAESRSRFRTHYWLAKTLAARERVDDAIEQYQRAAEGAAEGVGADHEDAQSILRELVELLDSAGRAEDADLWRELLKN